MRYVLSFDGTWPNQQPTGYMWVDLRLVNYKGVDTTNAELLKKYKSHGPSFCANNDLPSGTLVVMFLPVPDLGKMVAAYPTLIVSEIKRFFISYTTSRLYSWILSLSSHWSFSLFLELLLWSLTVMISCSCSTSEVLSVASFANWFEISRPLSGSGVSNVTENNRKNKVAVLGNSMFLLNTYSYTYVFACKIQQTYKKVSSKVKQK